MESQGKATPGLPRCFPGTQEPELPKARGTGGDRKKTKKVSKGCLFGWFLEVFAGFLEVFGGFWRFLEVFKYLRASKKKSVVTPGVCC